MNPISKFYDYLNRFRSKSGENPEFIPITRCEMREVLEGANATYNIPIAPDTNLLLGIPAFDTPFAEQMRANHISMPLTRIFESAQLDSLSIVVHKSENYVLGSMMRKLEAYVVSDISELEIEFEWDLIARAKRLLRITKWFPVKTRKVKVDCRVLYPYIKVSLPHNKHHVNFSVK